MNTFLGIVFILSYGFTYAAADDDIEIEQQLTIAEIQLDRSIHTLREFFGADLVELCSAAEIQQYAHCAAVFFRSLEYEQFWSLIDEDQLQGEFRIAFHNLMALQPQSYQTLFNHQNFRALLQHVRTFGTIAGVEVFAGKVALRDQSLVVCEEPLSSSEIYDLGERLEPITPEKSVLYFRIGILFFVGIAIYVGLHSHGII